MIRKVVASGVFAVVMLAVPAANAQRAVTARVTAPASGAVVAGGVDIRAQASSAAGITSIAVSIDGLDVVREAPGGFRDNVEVGYGWNTTGEVGSSQLARNGQYNIEVRATATGGATDTHRIQVIVDNPAATPTGVTTSVQGSSVTVSWAPNPEPDITGYIVERDSGSGFTEIGRASGTSYVDQPGTGRYSYRVTAVRASMVDSGGRRSAPSDPAGVEIAAPDTGSGGTGGTGGSGTGATGSRKTLNPFAGGSFGKSTGGGKGAAASLDSRGFAPRGISGGPALPGMANLPDIPATEGTEWGTYKERLPYELPSGGTPLAAAGATASGPSFIGVTPDRLKWLTAGLTTILVAGGLLFLARRMREPVVAPATESEIVET